jgi:choline dehydrogenase-like flavoprotein
MSDHYDVIIVGSGAGGGTLAHRLAPSGKRVLVLERGDWLPREIENWDAEAVFVENRYVSTDTWYDGQGTAFQPQVHYFVGGATKFYGAALYRLRERDFGELKHHDGISPAWPIGYDVMEPYYTQAEQLYQVHGARGEDPTDPPASAPYPFPPVSHEPRIQRLFDDMAAVGLHPFHSPSGVMLDEARPELSQCIRCATCDGFACLVHAKADADVIAVRPALLHDNVTLVRNARVRRLETDGSGRTVSAVLADVDGEAQRFSADVVVLSAGAVNSAAILLASANDQHPVGLANGSDQVGRNYVFHNSRAFLAVSTEKNDTRFQKTLGLNDYYFGDADFDYPMGNVQMVGKSSAPMYKGEKPVEAGLAPMFALRDVAEHAVDFWLSAEDLPSPANRVTLNRQGEVVLSYTPNNQEPMEQLYHRVKQHLSHVGMHPHHLIPRTVYMKNNVPVAGCAHQAGTVRFGTDPTTSVLDVDCKAHELDNLYVVDTSFFPSIGAVNPALTAIANALRVGDHLRERLG